jgi:hypothetical protein
MAADRYLKIILTIIACELLWLCVRDMAPTVAAQQPPAPVVITGFHLNAGDPPLRVDIASPIRLEPTQPVTVQVANQPLTVQTGKVPLRVQSVPAKGGPTPGLPSDVR